MNNTNSSELDLFPDAAQGIYGYLWLTMGFVCMFLCRPDDRRFQVLGLYLLFYLIPAQIFLVVAPESGEWTNPVMSFMVFYCILSIYPVYVANIYSIVMASFFMRTVATESLHPQVVIDNTFVVGSALKVLFLLIQVLLYTFAILLIDSEDIPREDEEFYVLSALIISMLISLTLLFHQRRQIIIVFYRFENWFVSSFTIVSLLTQFVGFLIVRSGNVGGGLLFFIFTVYPTSATSFAGVLFYNDLFQGLSSLETNSQECKNRGEFRIIMAMNDDSLIK